MEQDNFETIVSLKCLACNAILDHTQSSMASLIDSILLAQSAQFTSSVEGWEAELKPCEHTKNLNQEGAKPIAQKSMAHCGECDLRANLWLCMHCGHLGCGRKYFDGSGGNNHAVDHSDATKHAVACKLGTITPEGSACNYFFFFVITYSPVLLRLQ